ncbi:MAG: RNA-binding domain-containing protein [Candidatus Thorarchaeota archaeon]
MDVIFRCPIYPTEDIERVCSALTHLFVSDSSCHETEDGHLMLRSNKRSSLDLIRQYTHTQRIIDVVRKRVFSNWDGTKTSIFFDKQAAYYGKLRIVDETEEEPPLGCIELDITFEDETDFNGFLAWFAPPTKDGRVIVG